MLLHWSWCLLRLLRVRRLVDRRLLLLLRLLLVLLLLRLLLVLLLLRCLRHVLLLSLLLLWSCRLLLLGLHVLLLLRLVLHGSSLLGTRRLRVCGRRPRRRRRPVVLRCHIEVALLSDRLGALLRRRQLLPATAPAAGRSSPPPATPASSPARGRGPPRCNGMRRPLRLPLLRPRLLLQRGVLLVRWSTPPKTLLLLLLLLQLPGLSIRHQHLRRVGLGAATPAGIVSPPPAPALAPALCTWLVAAVVRAATAKQEQRVNTSNFGARTPVSMHLKQGSMCR